MSATRLIQNLRIVPYIPIRGKKYRFVITRYGIVYVGLLVAILVGSINHNNNLGYLLTFFLGSVLFVSTFSTFQNISGITVKGREAKPVYAGQLSSFPLVYEVESEKRPGIHMALDQQHERIQDLDNGKTQVTLSYPTTRRGMLNLSTIHLSSSFPLGLMKFETKQPIKLSCLVYPKPVRTPFITEQVEGDGEESGADNKEKRDSGDFTGLDLYSPGDSPKRIHWKGLAGGQGLFTKRFEGNEVASFTFSLQELPGSDVELKLSQLAYMILTAEAEGQEYGVKLGDQLISPGRGAAHKNSCLSALALYPR